MNNDLEDFKNKYRATVSQGLMRYTIPTRGSMYPYDPFDTTFETTIKTEYSVQIDMSQNDFAHLVHMQKNFYDIINRRGPCEIVEEYEREQRIRQDNPSVRIAYEKYQTLMNMVDGHYD